MSIWYFHPSIKQYFSLDLEEKSALKQQPSHSLKEGVKNFEN